MEKPSSERGQPLSPDHIDHVCCVLAEYWKAGRRHQRLGQLILNLVEKPSFPLDGWDTYEQGLAIMQDRWVGHIWNLDTDEFVRRMSRDDEEDDRA